MLGGVHGVHEYQIFLACTTAKIHESHVNDQDWIKTTSIRYGFSLPPGYVKRLLDHGMEGQSRITDRLWRRSR
ncbi:hypothetical protein RIR_jg22111.t1 [Rhizophagus irregularis DAOM 181602=DAOM 197198]|uniref:Uncharacterized protein n=1 Tax=Rhizophagus irregularis (strain DAOM 181602 / DAOM 197198 / MUCL 43194) TaxID=747089 RepID=U9SJT9_RHIID|nr:hypothetical protein RIR_jg22111.t1 [Rhizophagus irregularis DAOM 181602=DAOM 197198]